MDDPCYDLVLRDPEGGILQRWIINDNGWPCDGLGSPVSPKNLWEDVLHTVRADMAAQKESA